jgi:hypothetical protein
MSFDNRHRNRATRQFFYGPADQQVSGTRFHELVLDPAVGPEVALFWKDHTDSAYEIGANPHLELRLNSGLVRTATGPLAFLLWWVPPILQNKLPFALFEQLLNPTHSGTLELLKKLANQTHLHVVLIGPQTEALRVYEFVNTFEFGVLATAFERGVNEPALKFDQAQREFETTYDLETLFLATLKDQNSSD